MVRGEAELVLARVDELVTHLAELAEPEPGLEPASTQQDGPQRETWSTRETLLNTGMIAAGQLGQWEKMLAFSAGIIDSMVARRASQVERAGVEFMNYKPLVSMGRLGEARDLLRQCRDIFAEHRDDGLLGKALGALSDVEGQLGHHDIAARLGEGALRLAYTSADLLDIYTGHHSLVLLEGDDPATAFAHELAAAIVAYQAGLDSLDTDLRILANRMVNNPDRNLIPSSFAELCEAVSQVDGVDLGGLLARLWPDRSGDEILSDVLGAADSIELPTWDLGRYLHDWDPVIAAMLAAGLGANREDEVRDDRASGWIERSLRKRGSEDRWAALAGVLRRIVNGERDSALAEGLNPVDRAVVRRALDVLAGRTTLSPQAHSAWRLLDYLDDWQPTIILVAAAAHGNSQAAQQLELVFEKFRSEWDALKATLRRIMAGEHGNDLLRGLDSHDALIVSQVLERISSTKPIIVSATDSDADYPTIAAAYRAANRWDRIVVREGTYTESLLIYMPIEIVGEGSVQIHVDKRADPLYYGAAEDALVNLAVETTAASFRNLELIARDDSKPLVIVTVGELELDGCTLVGKSDCIYVSGTDARIRAKGCTIKDGDIGILLVNGGAADLEDCTISGNKRMQLGVSDESVAKAQKCRIAGGKNSAVVLVNGGGGKFDECEIHGNGEDGEPCVLIGEAGPTHFRSCKFFDNAAGIRFEGGTAVFEDCSIFQNQRNGVFVKGASHATMTRCEIWGSEWSGISFLGEGGGIFVDCSIHDNHQSNIETMQGADPRFRHCRIFDQQGFRGNHRSAAISVHDGGRGSFDECEIFENTSTAVEVARGDPTVRACKIHSNAGDGLICRAFGSGLGSFEDCDVYHNNCGVVITPGAAPSFERCHIHHNKTGVAAMPGAAGIFDDCRIADNLNRDVVLERPSKLVFRRNGRTRRLYKIACMVRSRSLVQVGDSADHSLGLPGKGFRSRVRPPTLPSVTEPGNVIPPSISTRVQLRTDGRNTAAVRISAINGLDYLGTLAFSPDGRTLAIRTFTMGAGGKDGKVILWDVADLHHPARAATLTHRSNSLYAMAFSPDGRAIATSANDVRADKGSELSIWDITDTSRPVRTCTLAGLGMVRTVAFCPDGQTLVTAGSTGRNSSVGEMILWDLANPVRSRFRKSWVPARIHTAHPPYIGAAVFSSDGRTLATAAGAAVILWDVTDPAQPVSLAQVTGPFEYMHTVAFSPDGRVLATADHVQDGRVALWDITDPAFPPGLIVELVGLATLDQCVVFSPDGRTLATASGGTKGSVFHLGDVVLWDMADCSRPARITALTELYHPRLIAFSPDGRTLATSGGVPGSVVLWDISHILSLGEDLGQQIAEWTQYYSRML